MDTFVSTLDVDNEEQLLKCVDEVDEYFGQLVDQIPIDEYGLDMDMREQLRDHKHKLAEGRILSKGKSISKNAKHRIARSHPDAIRTISQAQIWLAEQSAADELIRRKGQKRKVGPEIANDFKLSSQQQALRSRLSQQIVQLRSARKATGKSKRKERSNAKDDKNKLKRLKKQKAKLAKKTGEQHNDAKLEEVTKKLKEKSAQYKTKKTAHKQEVINAVAGSSAKQPTNHVADPGSDKKTLYSKFEFAVSGVGTTNKGKNKGKLVGKDYKRLLERVEARKATIAKLREEGNNEKADRMEAKWKWDAAEQRSQGFKIKDDEHLLAKGVARKEKIKKQSVKKWTARENVVKERGEQKQKRRADNIEARKTAKRDKGIKRAKRKGRYVPGF